MKKSTIIAIAVMTAILVVSLLTTSCQRASRWAKSVNSDFTGLERTAVLLDYEGDTVGYWEGKFDIRDDSSDNRIFFDLDGKRVWIQGGIFISEEK